MIANNFASVKYVVLTERKKSEKPIYNESKRPKTSFKNQ